MSSGSVDASGVRKKIGLASCLLMGLAIVSPLGPVSVFGPIQQITSGHMSLAFLIALIPMIFVAYTYGIFAAEFPRAGASYTYVTKGLHPYVGFITGWVLMLDYCLVPLMCMLITSLYFCSLFPAVNIYLVRVISIAIVFIVNLRTIKGVARINNIITAAVAAVMLYFVFAAINTLAGGDAGVTFSAKAFYNSETFGWSSLFAGAATCCFCFLGFDALTLLAEDVKNPRKTLPKALILLCVVMALFFVVTSWLGQCLFPDYTAYSSVDVGMLDPMYVAGGQALITMVSVGMVVAMFSIMLDMLAASTRLMYAMGREGAIPKKPFGYENPKTHVPTYNVILLSVISGIFMWVDVSVVITMITFGGLLGFVLVNLSAIRYFFFIKKDRAGLKFIQHLVMPIIGFLTSGYLWLSLGVAAQTVGFIWLGIGIVYLAISTKGFRRPVAQFADEVDAQFAQEDATQKHTEFVASANIE